MVVWRLLIHLLMLSNVLVNSLLISFSIFSKYDFRCLIGPLYGWSSSLHHQYGVEWAFSCGWVGMSFSRSILLPSFANLSASSFPRILVCALTLCKVVGVVRFFSMFTIEASIVLFGWLFYCVGCFIWVFMRYRELRLFVKMSVGSWENSWMKISSIRYMADISAWSMFCRPTSLFDIFTLSNRFQMPYPALTSSHISSVSFLGGINDPSV
jgi:hypothetical protein